MKATWKYISMTLATTVLAGWCATAPSFADAATPSFASVTAFRAPDFIADPTMIGASPQHLWYDPIRTMTTVRQVHAWLHSAKPVHLKPATEQAMETLDAPGVAELFLRDTHNATMIVYPAHSKHPTGTKGRMVANIKLYPGIVTVQSGNHISFIKEPQLYHWLTDGRWRRDFDAIGYTAANANAVGRVLHQRKWKSLNRFFVPYPGMTAIVADQRVRSNGHAHLRSVLCTDVTTAVNQGLTTLVDLQEIWANGRYQHTWKFTVSASGLVVQTASVGATPPQGSHP